MRHKVNPHNLRVGIVKHWETKWILNKEQKDKKIRIKNEKDKSRTSE